MKILFYTVNIWQLPDMCSLVQSNKKNSGLVAEFAMYHPAGNYMFKVNNENTRIGCEICSKLTIKTVEWCLSLSLTLNIFYTF